MNQTLLQDPYCLNAYRGKTILITGPVGTVGSQLLDSINEYDPAEIRLFDNSESGLFMQLQSHGNNARMVPVLGDIRDRGKLNWAMSGVHVVFHLAAYKHVTLCEGNPFDAVRTNVIGTQNVLKAALDAKVERFLYTSSDKAANPTNVMGTSKLLAERVVTAACVECWNGRKRKTFSVTRFGNVLGSNGSVIPIFKDQIRKGGPLTLTDASMTRFVMTVEESAQLLLRAAALAHGGEVFVTKMPVVRILDLAQAMIDLLAPFYGHQPEDIRIRLVGARPGEKMYEELMTEEETARALELKDMFVILPALGNHDVKHDDRYPNLTSDKVDNPYISKHQTPMTKAQIVDLLMSNNLLGDDITQALMQQPYLKTKNRRATVVKRASVGIAAPPLLSLT